MPKVTFHLGDAIVELPGVQPGTSVMRAAVQNGVTGIVGECGGQAMCATCHVYVHDAYVDALPEMAEEEDEMLDCAAEPRDGTRSRLGCQVVLGHGLEEIHVDVPSRQV
ncbi:ferredoxin [Streptomyces scabiei]|uniref:2Fe-2S iron-sulfur cluster-binding protein n=1 Tax=Streptomyces scabiei TaxID=1930 RepID=UPI0004E7A50A|nr:2Fe-2S iron-sulfur cluster-binding protein [Streptomyces scabiei]KFF98894.1 ferredoxin [Streptomyces scabiei]